jgi:hypothetical protein
MAIRHEIQHRVKHLGRSIQAGLSPLWVVIAAAVAVVGGSVLITVAWGARHLVWGMVILLVIIAAVITEGSYRLSRQAEATHQGALEAQHKAHQQELAHNPASTDTSGGPLAPRYLQREPYRLPNQNMFHHRIGIRNPAGNPTATGVRLQWTGMSPQPRNDLGYPPVIPQAVPMMVGGDPAIGLLLPAGQEELWLIATTATDAQGVLTVGTFGPQRAGWHGTPWYFEPRDRWRFTYRIVSDNLPPVTFSVVMTAVGGNIRCDLEG